ncbi:MAG TPA: site-2 protease family protein [Dehalococcoidia bacterium]|nr:site-2 protease family protein [Dehalococcoidia bacterium]
MIFAYLDLLRISVIAFVAFLGAVVVALLWGIAFHEFNHALAATRLGDPTARRLGRLSLNPLVHLDPAGTALLFLVGFGWGKPVPVNPYSLRGGGRQSMALVAAAGPLSNLFTAALFALPIKAGLFPWHTPFLIPPRSIFERWAMDDYVGLFLATVVIFNIILAIFNFIPLAPLDGFRVVAGILPPEMADAFLALERYGPVILILLLVLPFVTGGSLSPIFVVMEPVINGLIYLLTGVDSPVF